MKLLDWIRKRPSPTVNVLLCMLLCILEAAEGELCCLG